MERYFRLRAILIRDAQIRFQLDQEAKYRQAITAPMLEDCELADIDAAEIYEYYGDT